MNTNYQNDNNSLISENENYTGYAVIFLCTALFYIVNNGFYSYFCDTLVPAGDPFTYTTGFYELLDIAHQSYWNGLHSAFTRNWLWLMNLSIALLSPILVKAPYSVSLVNFTMFAFATASIYRLARGLQFGLLGSLVLAFLWWIYPSNYGFYTYQSTPVLALDAMFLNALVVATLNTLIYVIDPEKMKNAVIAGFSIGIAVWGRGNSAPVVLMVILIPCIYLLYQAWMIKIGSNKNALLGILLFFLISSVMTALFYLKNLGPLKEYYINHARFYGRHIWNIKDSIHWLINVPGFYFLRSINSVTILVFSISCHILALLSIILIFFNNHIQDNKRVIFKLISINGFLIYLSTYVINIYLFSDPIFTEGNCILIYAPMLLGLTLCLFSLIGSFLYKYKKKVFNGKILILIIICSNVYSGVLTGINTPKPYDSFLPTPQEVKAFSINLERLLKGGKTLSMLWYGHYNPQILDYYRLENGLPRYKKYRYKYADDIWSPTDFSDQNRQHTKEEIINHLQFADYLIIPEYTDYYGISPYALYRFSNDFVGYINSHEAPRFVVQMVLHDRFKSRLLLIQREEDAGGTGVPLKTPYSLKPYFQENDLYSNLPTDRFIETNHAPEIDTELERKVDQDRLPTIKVSSNMDPNNPEFNPALLMTDNIIWHSQVPPDFPEWVLLQYVTPVIKNKLIMKPQDIGETGNEYLRAPKDFVIQAGNDLQNWKDLFHVKNNIHKSGNDWHGWSFENTHPYLYYRIYITASGTPNLLTINRIYLE